MQTSAIIVSSTYLDFEPPRFWRTKDIYSKLSSVEDYGISEVTWCRHIVEALELRPEAALSEGAIMKEGKVRRRSRKRKKFHFI